MPTETTKPKKITTKGILTFIRCPECQVELNWLLDERSGIQNLRIVTCRTRSCSLYTQQWHTPTVPLIPV